MFLRMPKKTDPVAKKPFQSNNTMYITFQLNPGKNDQKTVSLDYEFLGDSYQANNVKPDQFQYEADNIEKNIRKYIVSCCDQFFGSPRIYFRTVNFNLKGEEDKVLFNKTKDYIYPEEAISLLRELEKETSNALGIEPKHRFCA